jgi:hypothetical protein
VRFYQQQQARLGLCLSDLTLFAIFLLLVGIKNIFASIDWSKYLKMARMKTLSRICLFFLLLAARLKCDENNKLLFDGESEVEFVVNDKDNQMLFSIGLNPSEQPRHVIEQFCAISDISDDYCEVAHEVFRKKYEAKFGTLLTLTSVESHHKHEPCDDLEATSFSSSSVATTTTSIVDDWLSSEVNVVIDPYGGRMGWCANKQHDIFKLPPRHIFDRLVVMDSTHTPIQSSLLQLAQRAIEPFRQHGVHMSQINESIERDDACIKVIMSENGEWYVTKGCRLDMEMSTMIDEEDDFERQQNLQEEALVPPINFGEEKWWRVRRRNSALEVLFEATKRLKENGQVIPIGVSILVSERERATYL